MEALMSMDDETLDSVLESCDAEELEIIDSAIETMSSDGKHHQTIPGTVNHAKKANELMPRIVSKIDRLHAAHANYPATSDRNVPHYKDYRYQSKNSDGRQLEKYRRIFSALEPDSAYKGEAQVVRDRGIGFTPQGTKDIKDSYAALKNDQYADTMPRYTAKKK